MKNGRRYVVLCANEADPLSWKEVVRVDATSAVQAVAQVGGRGTFVAIPLRSWKPLKAEVETVERVRIGVPSLEPAEPAA